MNTAESTWYMYVAVCSDNSYYCGITTDVQRRIDEHNGKGTKGAKYTRGRRPVISIFEQKFSTRSEASISESKFKKLTRAGKITYMVSTIEKRLGID